ncbi:RNase adapter RapZ [Georgenia yuyongxinii]|uniref:RNase adapter RapZ n=1 Tax=Georgenia yuyongxinii TaxID=2589797 RepID=A0A5B8C1V8_9MICO|nr:RNase adapter RapZ [Georgenia yuyongxinii]QDC24524.1 RNase adapter RapZ [Georgenia yuyongxinii]
MTAGSDETRPPTVPEGIPMLDDAARLPEAEPPELLILTGMSGAGRSRTAAALEDLDWYVVDNLPPRMLGALARMMTPTGGGVHRLAAVVDVRSGEFFAELVAVLDELRLQGTDYRIVFLDATDETLVRRYESVRRPHPLQGDGRLLDGITAERRLLTHLRRRADVLIDTTDLSVHDLARKVREVVAGESARPLRLSVVSFGFKYGLPLDADHVVDVRFLTNPYWVTELRHLTGQDEAVRQYVLGQDGASAFADRYVDAIAPVLDGYINELKPFVTIAVGCTGGKHRSVAMAEAISARLRERGQSVRTLHRDLGRE